MQIIKILLLPLFDKEAFEIYYSSLKILDLYFEQSTPHPAARLPPLAPLSRSSRARGVGSRTLRCEDIDCAKALKETA